jgi:hypothetical protein
MTLITIKIKGLDKVQKNIDRFGNDLPVFLQGARLEVADEILKTKGLRSYPPATKANFPPTPFYIRGRGTQTSGTRNTGSSERLGTRWEVVPYGRIGVKISNPVSYAKYVHGEEQARAMEKIGWAKLVDTAQSKIGVITATYEKWIHRLIVKYKLG